MSLYIVGILNEDGSINNALSIKRLAEVAVAYARAGRTNRAVCIYLYEEHRNEKWSCVYSCKVVTWWLRRI